MEDNDKDFLDGHESGFETCRDMVIECLEKNKNLTINEIILKIKSRDFEYGKF